MSEIYTRKCEKTNTILTVYFSVSEDLTELLPAEKLEIFYPVNVEKIPDGIAVIPFICNILPIVWVTDSVLHVTELDQDFYECIPEIKKGYKVLYPEVAFKGNIIVDKLTDNKEDTHPATPYSSALFYSGGVDSTDTLLRHLHENPVLFSIWGSDIRFDNEEGWNRMYGAMQKTAMQYGLTDQVIRSRFRTFLNEGALGRRFKKEFPGGWWHDAQHGIGLLGHIAPLAWLYGIKSFYIASSYCPKDGLVQIASCPEIDNTVRFAGCRVYHDGFECSRQDKIHNIVTYCRAAKKYFPLHVCWETQTGQNCSKCEKCYRTIAGFLAEGEDPNHYGFCVTEKNLAEMFPYLVNKKVFFKRNLAVLFEDIQERVRNNKQELCKTGYWKFLQWLDEADFSHPETITVPAGITSADKKKDIVKVKNPVKLKKTESKTKPRPHKKNEKMNVRKIVFNAIKKSVFFLGSKYIAARYAFDRSGWRKKYAQFRLREITSVHYHIMRKEFSRMMREAAIDGKGLRMEADFWLCWFLIGAVPEDYFGLMLFCESWKWRRHHITRARLNFIKPILNPEGAIKYLNNKALFNTHWEAFLHRKWCEPQNVNLEVFKELFGNCGKIVVKDLTGWGGHGIQVFSFDKNSIDSVYYSLIHSSKKQIVEEFIYQKGFFHDLNPGSVNTLRITTIKVRNEIRIMHAFLRTGVGESLVDNLHSGGVLFEIDKQTGTIIKGNTYRQFDILIHPYSKIPLAGHVINRWKEIIEFVIEAHLRAPEGLRLIGWDVCVNDDNLCLIEGNGGPGFHSLFNPEEDQWKEVQGYLGKVCANNV